MKRLVIRLSIVSVFVVPGLIAIAQARYGSDSPAAPRTETAAARDPANGAPEPIQLKPNAASPINQNPLRNKQQFEEPGLPSRLGHLPKSHATPGRVDEIPPASVVLQAPPEHQANQHSARYEAEGEPAAIAIPGDDLPADPLEMQAEADLRAYEAEEAANPRYGVVQTVANEEPIDGPAMAPPADGAYQEPARLNDRLQGSSSEPVAQGLRSVRVPNNRTRSVTPSSVLAESPATVSTPSPSDISNEPNPLRAASSSVVTPAQAPPVADPRFGQPASATSPAELPTEPRTATSVLPAPDRSISSNPSAAQLNVDDAEQGFGKPGQRTFEGPQTPSITLIKSAPEEIQVGMQCTFEIILSNAGQITADEVEVLDVVPQGTKLIGTEPAAEMNAQGDLLWQIGSMKAGDEKRLKIHLMPVAEGDIGSMATVRFQAHASARTVATRPQLKLETSSASTVMIGEDIKLTINISNPGSGTATGVMLMENIPDGMKHPAGPSLEFEVGTLAPGESRQLDLVLTAEQAGQVSNLLTAQANANLKVESETQFEVLAPALEVAVTGPKKRYLERPATYEVSISNPGTASAENVELTTYLPSGLKFMSANNAGTYDPQTHSVSWGLDELPANQAGSVELVAMPIKQGEQQVRVQGKANRGLADQAEQSVDVEGVAAVLFTVADKVDPVELNGQTTYEIVVTNQGSKDSTNVQVVALLPPGMTPVAAEGPARFSLEEDRVIFAPLPSLAPKAETTYQIKVQADRKGDQRVRVQLLTDEMQTPVTKEESTRVYADE